jgi:hypothetical protein
MAFGSTSVVCIIDLFIKGNVAFASFSTWNQILHILSCCFSRLACDPQLHMLVFIGQDNLINEWEIGED